MPEASGIVYEIGSNNTRVGMTYSIKIDGDDKYYGTYKTVPPCFAGNFVTFDYSTNGRGYHNADVKTIKVEAAPAAGVAGNNLTQAPAASAAAASAHKSADGRQASIVWQHSQEMALRFAAIAQEAGALDLGTKGGKEGKLEALNIWVDAKTVDYFKDATKASAIAGNPFEQDEAWDEAA